MTYVPDVNGVKCLLVARPKSTLLDPEVIRSASLLNWVKTKSIEGLGASILTTTSLVSCLPWYPAVILNVYVPTGVPLSMDCLTSSWAEVFGAKPAIVPLKSLLTRFVVRYVELPLVVFSVSIPENKRDGSAENLLGPKTETENWLLIKSNFSKFLAWSLNCK